MNNDSLFYKKMYSVIKKSDLFDPEWYLTYYSDLTDKNVDPVWHYINFGAKEGRKPNANFDVNDYTEHYPCVRLSNTNVVYHYETIGKYKPLECNNNYIPNEEYTIVSNSELFDADFYKSYSDLYKLDIDPVLHYCLFGWKENRLPNQNFKMNEFKKKFDGFIEGKMNPVLFFEYQKRRTFGIKRYNGQKIEPTDLKSLNKIIEDKNIKIISFDIFDTLLVRPTFNPKDLLFLVHVKLMKEHDIDFWKYRSDIEDYMNSFDHNINDMYSMIKRLYNLPDIAIQLMLEEELKAEFSLLSPRKPFYDLYLKAVKLGKKVVVTSDMYLGTDFLTTVLTKCGYDQISEYYVSCDCKKRKDDGSLFDYVIEKEAVKPSEIMHIGDNYVSDCFIPLNKGIQAFYYPSVKDIVSKNHSLNDILNIAIQSPDIFVKLLVGHSINVFLDDLVPYDSIIRTSVFDTWDKFVGVSLIPVVTGMVLKILNNQEIQSCYSKISFASRDGYLVKLVYDKLVQFFDNSLPSDYVYAGRRAYFSSECGRFIDYIYKFNFTDPAVNYTLKDFINAFVFDKHIKERVCSVLSDEVLELSIREKRKIVHNLRPVYNILDDYLKKHSQNSLYYYNKVFCINSDRELIFDTGYSGSISSSLMKFTGKIFDKIYFWESENNKKLDDKFGTKTFVLMNHDFIPGENLIYEELMSPIEGSCIGFDDELQPILENCFFSSTMIDKFERIILASNKFLDSFIELFGNYINDFDLFDTNALSSVLRNTIFNNKFLDIQYFDDIMFPDPVYTNMNYSLLHKILKVMQFKTPISLTKFDLNMNLPTPAVLSNNSFKIGLHIHMFNIFTLAEYLNYLINFPYHLDLFVTVCDERNYDICNSIFNNRSLFPHLDLVKIILSDNRGRDIAPWLICTKEYQLNYDYFCHVHSKESSYSDFGDKWRCYLQKNLLDRNAVIDIINLFEIYDHCGMIFPEMMPPLKQAIINNNIPLEGCDGEESQYCDFASSLVEHTDLYYSCGTMFWYRPKALELLFSKSLSFDEFSPEPISVGGSLAHALERLPGYFCKLKGYDSYSYTKYPYSSFL